VSAHSGAARFARRRSKATASTGSLRSPGKSRKKQERSREARSKEIAAVSCCSRKKQEKLETALLLTG